MSKKDDKTLKTLQKLSALSSIASNKTNEYIFLYTPNVLCFSIQKLEGPYAGIKFRMKVILPIEYP